ncbi:MAG TPA: ABC transporter permease [Gemmatimonadaceae bacterium]|nr:ABC transporter permease [Gemmatimonadaceae bacterium]
MHLTLAQRVRARLRRVVGLFRHDMDARLDEEMHFHIEMLAQRNRRAGLSPDDARRAALVKFGGRDKWTEASRDEYRSRPLDDAARDLRHALRTLRASPSFTMAAVATLAIGIGATTAIFSAVYGVLLEPLPFPDQHRLVSIYQNNLAKGIERDAVAPGNFVEWSTRQRVFSDIGAAEPFGLKYSSPEGEQEIPNFNVTRGFFPALGVRPRLGRLFDDTDYQPNRALSLVLSYGSWQRRFGGDPHIVGRTILISKAPATIIGVLPRDFSYLETLRGEMFAPKVFDTVEVNLRSDAWYYAVGRLRPGVSMAAASADMHRIALQLAAAYPATNRESGVTLVPLRDSIVGDTRTALFLLLGAVGFVLLIACTNVVNLLLAHTNRRAHEFAIRVALGAGRARVVRQVLTQCAVMSVIGGTAGVAVAYWAVGAIRRLAPASLPRVDEIRVDASALMFALAVTIATTLAFGVMPALRAARTDPQSELAAGGRTGTGARQRSLRRTFVAAEVALTVMLLVGSGLLARSFTSVIRRDRGYRADHVIAATMFVWQWTPTDADRIAFVGRLVDRVSHLPGVIDAGVTSSLPLMQSIGVDHGKVGIVGHPVPPGSEATAHITSLTPSAFGTLRMGLIAGRLFTVFDDSTSARVAVISEGMARRFWPNENPIGRHLTIGFYDRPSDREIVGVVRDVPGAALDVSPEPTIYLPHAQAATGSFSLVARTAIEPAALTAELRRTVAELNPEIPVASMQTLDDMVSDSLKPRRFVLALFGCFSLAALALALVGVYGVINNATLERSREFGVRIALGAGPRAVIGMVMAQGLGAALGGLALGLAGAAALTGVVRGMLFGVAPVDTITFASVALVMVATAALACYLPARRATRIDPLTTLRTG